MSRSTRGRLAFSLFLFVFRFRNPAAITHTTPNSFSSRRPGLVALSQRTFLGTLRALKAAFALHLGLGRYVS
jgi:hypothetical protein